MTRNALGGEDAAWLHMEDETNPMVVNGVLELAGPLPLQRVHQLLEGVAAIPRFRERVVEPALHAGPPRWEAVPDFELAEHVEHVLLDSPDDSALRAFIGDAVSTLLDRSRPLWRVYVIDRPSAGTTLLYRVHHSIGDGFALLGVLLSLCEGGDLKRPVTTPIRRRTRAAMALAATRALGRLVVLPPDPKTLLKGSLGDQKRVAWSGPLALDEVKSAAHAASATVNDVLVAAAAGALGRYLARRGETIEGLEVRAMVPVDLRNGAPPTALGNMFGLVVLGLPVGIADPVTRLAAVKANMDRLKGTPEAIVTHGILQAMGWAPRPVEDLGVWFFGTKASVVLTNVPGPRSRLSLAGVPVSRIMFWVPQSGRMGLGISILSYAGEVTVGILSDAGLVPDPDALVADLHAEFDALLARNRRRAGRADGAEGRSASEAQASAAAEAAATAGRGAR